MIYLNSVIMNAFLVEKICGFRIGGRLYIVLRILKSPKRHRAQQINPLDNIRQIRIVKNL